MGGVWEAEDLPCADLDVPLPKPPEPCARGALERGTTGFSATGSMGLACYGAPKALREALVGEMSAPGLKVNMLSASLEKAPETTLQAGSPRCDPENVTC